MNHIKAYFDGSCEPINPGGTAKWGYAICNNDGDLIKGMGGVIGSGKGMTNNIAEYWGIIECLIYLNVHHFDDYIEIFGDSKMVVNMVKGVWGKKRPHKEYPHLIPLLWKARGLYEKLNHAVIEWIPREQNQIADYFSKL